MACDITSNLKIGQSVNIFVVLCISAGGISSVQSNRTADEERWFQYAARAICFPPVSYNIKTGMASVYFNISKCIWVIGYGYSRCLCWGGCERVLCAMCVANSLWQMERAPTCFTFARGDANSVLLV